MSPPETVRVEVAPGVGLAADRWPGATPGFVLVHGLASNAQLWWACAERLCQLGHAVVSVDQRGHGRSDKPEGGYTLDQACADLVSVVEQLTAAAFPARPVMAGQSWGANVALELGYRRPDLFSGVVCVDGGTIDLSGRFADWEACAAALAPPRTSGRAYTDIEAFMQRAHPDWPASAVAAQLANFERRQDGTVAPWLSFEHHMELLRALWGHRPSTRYAGMDLPVLLVPADNGRNDFVRDKRASVEAAVAAIPQARAEWFSPADHDLHAQFPERLADLLHREATAGLLSSGAIPEPPS